MKRWRFSLLAIVMLLALLWQVSAVEASSGWTVVPSVNPPGDDTLFAVAATSARDAWTVGSANQGSYSPQTLTEHWNGSAWSLVPSPSPGPTFNKLLGVTALSSSDAWSVGYYQSNAGSVVTLIEYWNGSAWSVVASPNPVGAQASQLFAVSAHAANDIWAAGISQMSNNVTQTLIEHWNGTVWSIVTTPNLGGSYSVLRGIAAVSATSAWAVGNYSNKQGVSQTLTEHWNGTKWSVVASADPGSSGNYLFGVTPVPASNQLWTVGEYANGGAGQPLTERWNGTSWSVVPSPTINTNGNVLSGVTALSVNNAWATGQAGMSTGIASRGASGSSPVGKTLIMHWNGTRWSIVASPNPGTYNNSLTSVARVPGTNHVWTAGAYNNDVPPVQTLIEFFN